MMMPRRRKSPGFWSLLRSGRIRFVSDIPGAADGIDFAYDTEDFRVRDRVLESLRVYLVERSVVADGPIVACIKDEEAVCLSSGQFAVRGFLAVALA
jgi:hypothetical protein